MIVPLTRAGYRADTSPYRHIREFEDFVSDNYGRFNAALEEGQRIVGEWMNVATGTIYSLPHEPFVVFDVMIGQRRLPYDEHVAIAQKHGFVTASVISDGPPISIERALDVLGPFGRHGATEPVEGAVWRVERNGKFDFMAKFVRSDKVDGKYLPGISGEDYIYNSAGEKLREE